MGLVWWCLVVLLVAFAAQWFRVARHCEPNIRGDVLFVFAHPDDEAMFFTPLLRHLQLRRIHAHFLCLSTGDYDGLGATRVRELRASAAYYGLQPEHVRVVDHPQLQDGMRRDWPAALVSSEVKAYLQSAGTIGTVVTFDRRGVSGHPNHVAAHRGVLETMQSMPPGLVFLQLRTRGLLQKYTGPLALAPHLTGGASYRSRTDFVVMNGPAWLTQFWKPMESHASQLVWFRYLFVAFSSYTYLNEMQQLSP